MENRTTYNAQHLTLIFLIDVLGKMGGAERNLIMLAENLRAKGYKIVVCCLKGGALARNMEQAAFNVVELNLNRIYDHKGIIAAIKMIKIIRSENAAVLMTYHESSDFLGLLIALLTNSPIISNRRDMGFKLAPRHVKIYKKINRFFDHIVAVSSAVMHSVCKSQGVMPQRISVIPNGVDSFVVQDGNGRKKIKDLKSGSGYLKLCCLANIRKIKGQKYLVSAAHIVSEKFPRVCFYFAGATDIDRPYYAELQQQVKDLSLEAMVSFTGQLSPSQVPDFLADMDICVLPSLSEGMSNTLLEYMAAGKPVVATAVGGNPELVEDGETGFLVPPEKAEAMAEAILKLLKNPKLRSEMGLHARKHVERDFSVTGMVDKYEELMVRVYVKKKSK